MATNRQNRKNMTPHGKNSKWGLIVFNTLALLIVVVWGVSFINTRVLLDNNVGAIRIFIIRFVIAYLIIATISHKKLFANNIKDECLFILCGLCGMAIYYIAENMALEYTSTTNVSILTSTTPLITAFIVMFVYKEKLGKGMILGSFIAFAGVILVVLNSFFYKDSDNTVSINPLGDFLALLAATSFAIYNLVIRKLNANYDSLFITRKSFFYGIVSALPFLLIEKPCPPLETFLKPEVWGNILFLSLIASMLAFIVWVQAVERLGAVRTSNYLYLPPIVTLIASNIYLNEAITIIGLGGCALIIGGMYISEKIKFKGDNDSATNVAHRVKHPKN